jgi:putative lipoic acid-binding regulatory protein
MSSPNTVSKKRTGLHLRLFALFLDVSIFAGLSAALMFMINLVLESTFGSMGLGINSALLVVPIFLLYLGYFSSEIFNGKTIGKQLLKIELRGLNGEMPSDQKLMRRFLIKHTAALLLFLYTIFDIEMFSLLFMAVMVFYVISSLAALGSETLSFHDRISALTVFPTKAPQIDINQVSQGKNTVELVKEMEEMRNERRAQGMSTKRMKTPSKESFPCAVELKVYTQEGTDMEQTIYDCFAQFVPNVHPNQVKAHQRTHGAYHPHKVVMRFDNELQMEASYEALAQVPEVVMTITVKSVRLPKNKKGKAQKLTAHATIT